MLACKYFDVDLHLARQNSSTLFCRTFHACKLGQNRKELWNLPAALFMHQYILQFRSCKIRNLRSMTVPARPCHQRYNSQKARLCIRHPLTHAMVASSFPQRHRRFPFSVNRIPFASRARSIAARPSCTIQDLRLATVNPARPRRKRYYIQNIIILLVLLCIRHIHALIHAILIFTLVAHDIV